MKIYKIEIERNLRHVNFCLAGVNAINIITFKDFPTLSNSITKVKPI